MLRALQPAMLTADTVPPTRPRWYTYLFFAVASLWVLGVTFVIHGSAWLADQFLTYENTPLPWFAWPLISWGHGLALAAPLALLAFFTRMPLFRAIYRAWLIAVAFVFVLAFARAFAPPLAQPAALAQIVLSLICVFVLRQQARAQSKLIGAARPDRVWIFALGLVPIVSAPSIFVGALGSPLDVALNLLAALSLGWFAGIVLDAFIFQTIAASVKHSGRELVFGGWVASVTLVILAGGFGYNGGQLLLLVTLPPLGFALAAISRLTRSDRNAYSGWLAVGTLVGLSASAPMLFVDPGELSILLGDNDILSWATKAAFISCLLAWLVGMVLLMFRSRLSVPPRAGLVAAFAVVTWMGGVLLFASGRPGFYGEQLFVILKEEADLRPAAAIADRSERTRFVYNTLTAHANRTQANLRATLDAAHIAYHSYYLVNGVEVNAGPLVRAYLATRPDVARILDSPHLRPLPAPVPVSTGDQPAPAKPEWNITLIGADRVWNELHITGKGIIVGQSDSGVQGDHPALRDGYRGRDGQNDYNWIDPWNHTRAPTDIGGHGTHTLGSIVGRGNIGVAPNAEWFACVNLARNLGNPPLYLTCMQFMLAPWPQNGDPLEDGDPTKAAMVINDSWGCPPLEGCDPNALEPAARALRAAGIFVVASAGNEGPRCSSIDSPLALYADVFSVGAVDRNGNIADFSSRGPVTADGSQRVKPDISAPGVDVLSSFPGNTYTVESGTSMAGPHVVGVVALMWSANPKLLGDVERTAEILRRTAQPYKGKRLGCFEGDVPNNAFGYGVVDAYAAVTAAMQAK
jgi:subtilase family protein